MKRTLLLSLAVLTCLMVHGQNFMPTFGQTWNRNTYVIKNDNSRVDGIAKSGMVGMNGLMWIVLKDSTTGEKTKYKIEDIKEVGIDAKGGSKLGAITSSLENTNSLKEMAKTDYKSVLNADYYIYRRVVDKKGKPRILQLVNPGFESKMQVYVDPKAKETGGSKLTGGLVGGEEKSFYVTKGNSYGIYLKKSKYDKTMTSVFDDCPALIQEYGKNVKWSDLSKHVYYYEKRM